MAQVRVTFLIESSEHDGYCSGNECEYLATTVIKTFDVPTELQTTTVQKEDFDNFDWEMLFVDDDIEINDGNSCFCELSDECVEHHLDKHERKYTVVCVERIASVMTHK